jgi:tetratricopeptide (TPR) repeat protein
VFGPVKGWWRQDKQSKTMLAAGQKQAELGEYAAAFDTYSDLLKTDPNNVAASHGRLDVAMLWVEDFRVSGKDDNEIAQKAASLLTRIGPVLEAGLTTGKGYRDADVVAHLAWLNALKDNLVGDDAKVEQHLVLALKMDPANVYANAMMGDWLLENHRSLDDAKKHFAVALAGGKARPFVRDCELGPMIYNQSPGVRAELIRVVNDMRKQGEPISDDDRGRVHDYFSPGLGSDAELREVLTAVPPEEEWATYQWIDRPLTQWEPFNPLQKQFIQASLWEIEGKRSEALQAFRQLQQQTQHDGGTLPRRIQEAVKRLSK